MPLLRESMNESLVTESHQRQASVSFDEKIHLLMRDGEAVEVARAECRILQVIWTIARADNT